MNKTNILLLVLLAIASVNAVTDSAQCPTSSNPTDIQSSQVDFVKKSEYNDSSTSSLVRFTNVGLFRVGVYEVDTNTSYTASDIDYTTVRLVFHSNDEKSTSIKIERYLAGSIKFINAIQGTVAIYTQSLTDSTTNSFRQIITTGNTEA